MNISPTDLHAQQQTREEAERRAKAERETQAENLKAVMGTRQGRRFVRRLLERAGVYRSSFNQDALSMAFAEGGRNTGLVLLAEIQRDCPELYMRMLEEQLHG